MDDFVLVPRVPTKAMLDAAWADAHDEDALWVWNSMIEEHENHKVLERSAEQAKEYIAKTQKNQGEQECRNR